MNRKLALMLATPTALLLDFDGPLCRIFANYTNTAISSTLRSLLSELDVQLPEHVINEWDPLEILRWTATLAKPSLTHATEDALRAAEANAATTATPTPGAREVLVAAHDRRQRVGIVSNNSVPAIAEYLRTQGLSNYISHIVGREPYCPDLMKPNPHSVLLALDELGMGPGECLLIGDSPTDVTAARAVDVPVIGFANASWKEAALEAAGADAVVTSMADIAAGLRLASGTTY
jgi:HAD superfamily hydrolase (TIGR01549 family)